MEGDFIVRCKKAIEQVNSLQRRANTCNIAESDATFRQTVDVPMPTTKETPMQTPTPYQLIVIPSVPLFMSNVVLARVLSETAFHRYTVISLGEELDRSINLSPDMALLQSGDFIYIRKSRYQEIWNRCKLSPYYNLDEVKVITSDTSDSHIIDKAIIPNHLYRISNTSMFDNSPDLEGAVLAIGEQLSFNSYCFMELLGDLHKNGLLQNIFNDQDSCSKKLRFLVHLLENTTEQRSFSCQFYTKLCNLYGRDNLLDYLDVVRQTLYRLVHYQWTQISENYIENVKRLTFKLRLPDREHEAELAFNQLSNLIKEQFVKNDGKIDYENASFHKNFWKSVIKYVHKLTNSYDVLRNKCEGEIAHTVNFLTDELKIGNDVNDHEIIDPISHEAVERSDPEKVYYHMESSGTLYLFNKETLKRYILQSGDISNPCTRVHFNLVNLKQIGLTQIDLETVARQKETERAGASRPKAF